jgi:hypothetical protein
MNPQTKILINIITNPDTNSSEIGIHRRRSYSSTVPPRNTCNIIINPPQTGFHFHLWNYLCTYLQYSKSVYRPAFRHGASSKLTNHIDHKSHLHSMQNGWNPRGSGVDWGRVGAVWFPTTMVVIMLNGECNILRHKGSQGCSKKLFY